MKHLYSALVNLRNAASSRRNAINDDYGAVDRTEGETWWYQQGRAEAFAEVMTLIEQES